MSASIISDAANRQQLASRFGSLSQPVDTRVLSYIWIDQSGLKLRFKQRTLFEKESESGVKVTECDQLPWWDCAEAAAYINADVFLEPIMLYSDPFFFDGRDKNQNLLVLCAAYAYDYSIPAENKRNKCVETLKKQQKGSSSSPSPPIVFFIEQKYKMFDASRMNLLNQPPHNSDNENDNDQNHNQKRRMLADSHLKACLFAGIAVQAYSSVDDREGGSSSSSLWQFEVGDAECDGVTCADHLWMARFLLVRLAEDFNIVIRFEREFVCSSHSNHHLKFYASIADTSVQNRSEFCETALEKFSKTITKKSELKADDDILANYNVKISKTRVGCLEFKRSYFHFDPYELTEALINRLASVPTRATATYSDCT